MIWQLVWVKSSTKNCKKFTLKSKNKIQSKKKKKRGDCGFECFFLFFFCSILNLFENLDILFKRNTNGLIDLGLNFGHVGFTLVGDPATALFFLSRLDAQDAGVLLLGTEARGEEGEVAGPCVDHRLGDGAQQPAVERAAERAPAEEEVVELVLVAEIDDLATDVAGGDQKEMEVDHARLLGLLAVFTQQGLSSRQVFFQQLLPQVHKGVAQRQLHTGSLGYEDQVQRVQMLVDAQQRQVESPHGAFPAVQTHPNL